MVTNCTISGMLWLTRGDGMIIFILGCLMATHRKVGVIDIIDYDVCSIQLEDETYVLVHRSVCNGLKEGDAIEVRYDKDR